MKVLLTATQYTDNGKTSITLPLTVNRANFSKALGTALFSLFGFIALQQKHRLASGLKCNEVTDIKLIVKDNAVIDTATIQRGKNNDVLRLLRAKLKLRNTATSKKAFAQLVYDIVEYMTKEQHQMTFEELLTKLDNEIENNRLIAKAQQTTSGEKVASN